MKPFICQGYDGRWYVAPTQWRWKVYQGTEPDGYDTLPEAVDAVYALFREPS